jgi:23S rRNA (adenine2503-C2)-methyltransferase
MESPYLTDPEELGSLLDSEPSYRVEQLSEWLYKTPVATAEEMTNLPGSIREAIGDNLWPFKVEALQRSDGGDTVKWLFRMPDGPAIEAVLMGYPRRTTLCISSQAGCALGCTFCATGQFGFERNLKAGEIVAQVQWAEAYLRAGGMPGSPSRVTNIVYMGMGEPLVNYRNIRESLRRLIDVRGMGARRITVSTVGVAPAMKRLADEPWQVGLAVSLHAGDDDLRDELVPLNQRYDLEEVEAAAAYFFEKTGRRVSIEWTMIKGRNDTLDQAAKLARIARRLSAHVNLIAMNPTPLSSDQPSSDHVIKRFESELDALGVNATVRHIRGKSIDAACGQLRAAENGKQGLQIKTSTGPQGRRTLSSAYNLVSEEIG